MVPDDSMEKEEMKQGLVRARGMLEQLKMKRRSQL